MKNTILSFIAFLFCFSCYASPAYAGFLEEDEPVTPPPQKETGKQEQYDESDSWLGEEPPPPPPPPKKTPKKSEAESPPSGESPPLPKGPPGGPGPIVENGSVKPLTALRFLDSFNEVIGLTDDQVYMAMGIIKQESWFKIGAKNKATIELVNHKGIYDSDACVGLGHQLMAVAIQDLINNDLVPLSIIESDPDMRDDYPILKNNIVPGTYRGKTVYRYTKKAVIVLVTNPKLSLLLSAAFIKRTEELLKSPTLTGVWYNGLIVGQQLKAVPMTYNAGIGRTKSALVQTLGRKKTVENVARKLTGGADKMYYAKVTKFAEKFKEMRAYDVAASLNKAIGLRPLTKEEKSSFAGKKEDYNPQGVSKSMDKKKAIATYLKLERNMSVFLSFDDTAGNEDFIGTWTMTDEEMRDFRKGLNH